MNTTRRASLLSLVAAPAIALAQSETQNPDDRRLPIPKGLDEDERLPNGKLQKDEIARQQHVEALKDVQSLLDTAEELKSELKRAGDYVVPVTSVRRTEEIEKLAKRIRGRLKS